ncbi:MAG: phosphate ABC transporter permease subunit PstC [Erysipelotrichaceae bacterium]
MNDITRKNLIDKVFKIIVMVFASLSIISLGAILVFILVRALPLFKEVNIIDFITGTTWSPSENIFGIAPFILSSLLTTMLAVVIGIPIGLYTAIFIAEIANKHFSKLMLNVVEILAAIPSVIYGFFGITVVVPFIQDLFNLRSGSTLLTASLILALMVLPTVVSLSTSALKSVPTSIKEGSLALGATKLQTIFKTMIPYAKSGILTSFVLGIGRALGETMAVILIAGNSTNMPILNPLYQAFLNGGRTLTGNIVIDLDYASGIHESALFATGVILFLFVSILNLIILYINNRKVK